MSLTAEAPVQVLVQSLNRAGWGELTGNEWQGVRSTLMALANRARSKSYLTATVWQLSQSTGLSEKWTSRCLTILEGLGVITWQRGWIDKGKPRAGFIQIIKARLLCLVREAWAKGNSRWIAQRAATARRLQALKKPKSNLRRSRRVELSSYLNTFSGGASAPAATKVTVPPPAWAVGKEEPMNPDSLLCDHGYLKDGNTCPHCHSIQDNRKEDTRRRWTKAQRKAYENERARRNWAELERRTQEERQLAAVEFRREHPCPPDVDPADWGRVYINRLLAGVKS